MAAIGRSAPAVAVDSPSGLSTSTSSASRLGPRPSAVATAPELHLDFPAVFDLPVLYMYSHILSSIFSCGRYNAVG